MKKYRIIFRVEPFIYAREKEVITNDIKRYMNKWQEINKFTVLEVIEL